MSYKKPDTKNSMNDYFTRLQDFYLWAPKYADVRTMDDFDRWLDKLIRIDARSTILYVRKHWDEFKGPERGRILTRLPNIQKG